MQLSDSRDINAPIATVWTAILNPEVLKACVPGCESMSGQRRDRFRGGGGAKGRAGVGALFRGGDDFRPH